MAMTPFALAAALSAVGVAQVFIGDPLTAPGGMTVLGATEGDITVSPNFETNALSAPEITGGVAHQATTTLGNVTVTVPVIMGDDTIWAKITPTGVKGGGHSIPQKVVETSVVIVPLAELGGSLAYPALGPWARTAGNGVAAASGAGAAPKNTVWLWRAFPMFNSMPYKYGDGGKVIVEVTFTAMFSASKPEGHKVYTIGDPQAVSPVAIPVLI